MEEAMGNKPTPIETRPSEGEFLRIDPQGAKIELRLGNEKVLTTVQRGDGKEGKTHPCSPIFGPDLNNIYGLSQHGNMRNETSDVSIDSNEIMVKHKITDLGYPEGVMAEEKLKVENDVFSLDFTHKNLGEKEAAVNMGMHFYFDAPQSYKGTTINGSDISKLIEENPNGAGIELSGENIISIPGKKNIILKQNGFPKAYVWVGRDKDGNIDPDYICIEPIEFFPEEFGSKKTMIEPEGERTVNLSLSLEEKVVEKQSGTVKESAEEITQTEDTKMETQEKLHPGINTVIFDVDGVLIDSFKANLHFYQNVSDFSNSEGKNYIRFTEETYKEFFGKGREKVIDYITGGNESETKRLMKLADELSWYPIEDVELVPGAEELLKTLSESPSIKSLAIVTSRRRKDIYAIPALKNLLEKFKLNVCANDTENQKPDPEPLDLVVKLLKIKPEQAIYIGDQKTDIEAATAAGMNSVFFGENPTGNPNRYITSLIDLPKVIDSLN